MPHKHSGIRVINRLRKARDNRISFVLFKAGDQNNAFLIFHFVHDADDLIGIFSLPENDFRKPFAQRTVVINMGVFDILVADVAQFSSCSFNGQPTIRHRFQKGK